MATSLCRCICGSGKTQDGQKCSGAADLTMQDEDEEAEYKPANVDGLLSYYVLAGQPLRGVPIREGELWYLSAEESVDPVTLSLHVNGLSFVLGKQELSVSFSPFSLVRNCKFGTHYSNSLNLADFRIFKVSLFTQGMCYYFGVRCEDEKAAEEERQRWVLDISRAMRLVTQSLFPQFRIVTQPVAENANTGRRIMAGYLIHHEDVSLASVLYCELHAHQETASRLVFYENELCQVLVLEICLTEHAICCEKIGINCSCFSIEDHHFATRTLSERKLWLRAISNVKVKLQNRAPTPGAEEIEHYRQAIREQLQTVRPSLEGRAPTDALLQRAPAIAAARPLPPAPPFAPPADLGSLRAAGAGLSTLQPRAAAPPPATVSGREAACAAGLSPRLVDVHAAPPSLPPAAAAAAALRPPPPELAAS